jgi:hypothetical protein
MTTIFETLELDAQTEIKNLEQFVEVDVWPFVQEFFAVLLSQAGRAAVTAAVANIPAIVTGNESVAVAAVAAAVASSLAANAAGDAQKALSDAEANSSSTAAPAPTVSVVGTPGPSGDN